MIRDISSSRWVPPFPRVPPNLDYGGHWLSHRSPTNPDNTAPFHRGTQGGWWSGILFPGDMNPVLVTLSLEGYPLFPFPSLAADLAVWAAMNGKYCSENSGSIVSFFVSFHVVNTHSWASSAYQHSKSIPSPWGLSLLLTVLSDSFCLNLGPDKTFLMLDHLTSPLTHLSTLLWPDSVEYLVISLNCLSLYCTLFVPPLLPELI